MNTELAISLLKIFKNDAANRIIEVLRQYPGSNQIDVMVKLRDKGQPYLSQKLTELIRLNIVHCKRDGKNKHYFLNEPIFTKIESINEIALKAVNNANNKPKRIKAH